MDELEKRFKASQKKFREHLKQIKRDLYPKQTKIDVKPLKEAITYIDNVDKWNIDNGICPICGKKLKNKHGAKIHIGKVHKTNKQTNKFTKSENKLIDAIVDKGKQVRDYPEYKKQEKKILKQVYKKQTYYCTKCERFHKYLYHGKISKTHKNHIKHIWKYKHEISNYALSKMDFKKKWKNVKSYKV